MSPCHVEYRSPSCPQGNISPFVFLHWQLLCPCMAVCNCKGIRIPTSEEALSITPADLDATPPVLDRVSEYISALIGLMLPQSERRTRYCVLLVPLQAPLNRGNSNTAAGRSQRLDWHSSTSTSRRYHSEWASGYRRPHGTVTVVYPSTSALSQQAFHIHYLKPGRSAYQYEIQI